MVKNNLNHLLITTILLINICFFDYVSPQCATFFPRTSSQCYSYSTNEDFCCHLTRFEEKSAYSICYKIPVTKYADVSDVGFLMLGINKYSIINCGPVPGSNCNSEEPLVPEDCYQYSESSSYCCMVEVPGRKKRCVYSGNSNRSAYTTDNGIDIKCDKK